MLLNNITSDVLYKIYKILYHWFSLYAVFKVHFWLIVYQSSELKTSFELWSLVNPALTALPCWLGWPDGLLSAHTSIYVQLRHTVSSAVPSAVRVLTIVFGMGTGVAPGRIATKKAWVLSEVFSSLEPGLFAALGEVFSNLARRTLLFWCSFLDLITRQ